MSIVRTAKGLTLARDKPGVTKLMSVNDRGIPIGKLGGLWYFEQGSNGSVTNPPYTDAMGFSNATIHLGASPTKRSYGHEMTDVDGVVYDSGIAWPVSGAVIMALKHTVSLGTEQYLGLAAPESNNFPATQGGSFGNAGHPYPNIWTDNTSGQEDSFGMLDNAGTHFGTSFRPHISATKGPASSWNIMAFRWNNTQGWVDVCTLWRWRTATAYESVWIPNTSTGLSSGGLGWAGHQHANMVGAWTGLGAYNVFFGIWPFSTIRPATGQVGCAAVCVELPDDDELKEIMLRMAEIMIGRGVSVSGYPGTD